MFVEIYDKQNSKFDVTNDRYKMIFALENAYGIFRYDEESNSDEAKYEIIYYQKHNCVVPDDVLKDLYYLLKAGTVEMRQNDVVSIKISGAIINYRFLGLKSQDPEMSNRNFIEIKGFLKEEQSKYMSMLHSNNRVLDILRGEIYEIDKLVYKGITRAQSIKSKYYLYKLNNLQIEQIGLCSGPFISVEHALYFYFRLTKQDKNTKLLLNRQELEMIKDHYQLQSYLMDDECKICI